MYKVFKISWILGIFFVPSILFAQTISPALNVGLTANQTVVAGTENVVQFNTEVFDNSQDYDPATYRFTPRVAGTYIFHASVYCNGAGLAACTIKIRKNGTSGAIDVEAPYVAASAVASASVILQL